MKKLSLLTLGLVLFVAISSCKKDDDKGTPNGGTGNDPNAIAQVQNTVIFYFGGTWCGPCGAYGKPAKETIHKNNPSGVTIISSQVNGAGGQTDPMNNTDANNNAGSFGVSSVPAMYVGANNGTIKTYIGNGIVANSVQGDIDANKALKAVANSTMTLSLTGDNLTVNTKTKFFTAGPEAYNMAVFVTENDLHYSQYLDGSQNKDIHDFVLRDNLNTAAGAIGDLLVTAPTANQVVEKQFTTTLNSSWNKDNLYVHIVTWQKNSAGKFAICNGTTMKLK